MHFPSLIPFLIPLSLLTLINPTLAIATQASSSPSREAQYQTLPSLRESAKIQDKWRDERVENIPNILTRWGVDAWLVGYFHFYVI